MAEGFSQSSEVQSQEDLDSQLWDACLDGNIPEVEALIAKGASVTYKGQGGKTPVAIAAYLDHGELVRLLITKYNADPEVYDEKDCTALFEACGQENVSAVKALIKSGANIESLTKNGASTFLVACNVGNMEILKYLISCGANRNIVYKKDNITGKILAQRERHENVVQYLSELDLYDHKMQQSYDEMIEVEFTKFSIHSAAGSGKTCLQHLLLSEDPPCERESTDVSTAAVRGMRDMSTPRMAADTTTTAGIERVNDEKSIELLVKQTKVKLTVDTEPPPIPEGATPLSSVACDGGKTWKSKVCSFLNRWKKHTPSQQQQPLDEPPAVADRPKSLTSCGMLSLLPSTTSSSSYTLRWVYGADSGGQPAFQDIAPAFLRQSSVVILTLKLNEKLSDYPNMEYMHKGTLIKEPGRKQLTNLQMILNLARSLSSIRQMKCSGMNSSRPKLIIVGTFYDEVHLSTESIEEKNKVLKDTLLPFKDSIFLTPQDDFIHPIYNLVKRGEGREKKSEELCQIILNSYGAKQTSLVPLRHLMFQFEIFMYAESKGKDILSIDECYEVGCSVRIDNKDDVEDALIYLDSLGVLLYFHSIIPDLVFIKPQVILKYLSDLISLATFKEESIMRMFPEYARHWSGSDRRHVFNNACFNRSILDVVLPKTIFTVNHFIDLMINLLVIAEVPGTREEEVNYFLPCALPWDELTDEGLDLLMCSDPAPIHLFWKDSSIIPYGIFLGTVNALLSYDDGYVQFKLHMLKVDGSSVFNRRNVIFLNCEPFGGRTMLIDRVTHMEVHYSGPEPDCHCPAILAAIKCCMAKASNTYLYDNSILMAVEECFPCVLEHVTKHFFRVFHVVRQLEGDSRFRGTCQSHENVCVIPLSTDQLKWFEATTECIDLRSLPKDRQLDMEDYRTVCHCLEPIISSWRTLAMYFDLKPCYINLIEKNRLRKDGGPRECFQDMIEAWLKLDNDCTIERIVKALEQMHYNIKQ